MEFLEIPEEVIADYLLPLLPWNDLLRFRRVCQFTRRVTDDFLQGKKCPTFMPSELEINETDKSFARFNEVLSGLPIPKIYLNNYSGLKIYDTQERDWKQFLLSNGPRITHLRVNNASSVAVRKEREFLEGLGNLEHLHIENVLHLLTEPDILEETVTRFNSTELSSSGKDDPFPSNFKGLKGLKISKIHEAPHTESSMRLIYDWNEMLMEVCANTEYLSLAMCTCFFEEALFEDENGDEEDPLISVFESIAEMINKRYRDTKKSGEEMKLKFVDFKNICETQPADRYTMALSRSFVNLLLIFFKCGVMALNVSAPLLHTIWEPETGRLCMGVPKTVKSMINLHPQALNFELPYLENLKIKTSQSTMSLWRGTIFGNPLVWEPTSPYKYDALRVLEVVIDSQLLPKTALSRSRPLQDLYEFLFYHRLPSLEEMSFQFDPAVIKPTCPTTERIVLQCPNLKKLKLINWSGKNKALLELWEGLPALEEIWLEDCALVGNVTFVGLDIENPVFFKMKNLKTLTLKGLHKMPKITDTVFHLVIRHLKLKQLIMHSYGPIQTITPKGIRTLLTGDFAKTIEKFPFDGFKLSGCSRKEMKSLESEFRSSQMF